MTNAACVSAPRYHSRRSNSLWHRLEQWADLRRQRVRLAELDDRALDDIGVSRKAARREARKPFWLTPFFR